MRMTKDGDRGTLIVAKTDKFGRADARLVSLVSKISRDRELKGRTESLYHCEDSYKEDKPILKFDWADKDKIAKIVRLNGHMLEV